MVMSVWGANLYDCYVLIISDCISIVLAIFFKRQIEYCHAVDYIG